MMLEGSCTSYGLFVYLFMSFLPSHVIILMGAIKLYGVRGNWATERSAFAVPKSLWDKAVCGHYHIVFHHHGK